MVSPAVLGVPRVAPPRGVAECEIDRLIPLVGAIIQDGDADCFGGRVPIGKAHGAGGGGVVRAGRGAAVARGKGDADGPGAAVCAGHGDRHATAVFVDTVGGGTELEGAYRGIRMKLRR